MSRFIAINTRRMKVIAATETVEQCEAHADIKCKEDNFIITSGEGYDWLAFTVYEKNLLYRNLTGRNLTSTDNTAQAREINAVLRSLDIDNTPLEELNKKRTAIPLVHAEGNHYNLDPPELPGNANLEETTMAKAKAKAAPKAKAKVKAAPAKPSSNKAIIHAAMNEKWNTAGKPMDVGKLRIELMNEMAKSHPDIKRSTISVTLGGWVKERISK